MRQYLCYCQNFLLYCVYTRFFCFAGPPDAPENCDVHNHTTQGLSVTCQRGFGGGLEQTFHMEVRDRHSGHLLQNLSKTEPIFTVRQKQSIFAKEQHRLNFKRRRRKSGNVVVQVQFLKCLQQQLLQLFLRPLLEEEKRTSCFAIEVVRLALLIAFLNFFVMILTILPF